MNVGQHVRRIRKEQRYTQTEIARRCGVTPAAISGLEHGDFTPSTPLLVKLARALGVEVQELLEGGAEPSGKAGAPSASGQPEVTRAGDSIRFQVTDSVGAEDAFEHELLSLLQAVARRDVTPAEALPRVKAGAREAGPTEEAREVQPPTLESLVAELVASQQGAVDWVAERIHSGALSVEAVRKDGRRYVLDLEDLDKLGSVLESDLISHLYVTLRPLEDSWRGGNEFAVKFRLGDTD